MLQSFEEFMDGIGGRILRRATGLELPPLSSWEELRKAFAGAVRADVAVLDRIKEFEAMASTGEAAVLACTMQACGYPTATTVRYGLECLEYPTDEHLNACLSALARGRV